MNTNTFNAIAIPLRRLFLIIAVASTGIVLQLSVTPAQGSTSCLESSLTFDEIVDKEYIVKGDTVEATWNNINLRDFAAYYESDYDWSHSGRESYKVAESTVEVTVENICLTVKPIILSPKFKNSLMASCFQDWSVDMNEHELDHADIGVEQGMKLHNSLKVNPIVIIDRSEWDEANAVNKSLLIDKALIDLGNIHTRLKTQPAHDALDLNTKHGEYAKRSLPVLGCGTKLEVEPQDTCLKKGERLRFKAYANTDYYDVNKLIPVKYSASVVKWSPAERFAHDLFVAPLESGSIEVTAKVETLSASTQVKIDNCDCPVGKWSLRLAPLFAVYAKLGVPLTYNSGERIFTFDENGGFKSQSINLTVTGVGEVEGWSGIMVFNSTGSGKYKDVPASSSISISESKLNGGTTLFVPGAPKSTVTLPAGSGEPFNFNGTGSYNCIGDEVLEITMNWFTGTFDRLEPNPE